MLQNCQHHLSSIVFVCECYESTRRQTTMPTRTRTQRQTGNYLNQCLGLGKLKTDTFVENSKLFFYAHCSFSYTTCTRMWESKKSIIYFINSTLCNKRSSNTVTILYYCCYDGIEHLVCSAAIEDECTANMDFYSNGSCDTPK